MRFIYCDESGTGDPGKEPWVVVSAVMVHADYQLKLVEKYLSDMADDYIRPEHREDFSFHASDMANGNDIYEDREKYPSDLVRELLKGVCNIPELFKLPVAVAHTNRAEMKQKYPALNKSEVVTHSQAISAMACTIACEAYMRHGINPDEVAVMVYENNEQAKRTIALVHQKFKQERYVREFLAGNDMVIGAALPLERIAENAFFTEKRESALLQVADAVAFAVNRKLRKFRDADIYFEPLINSLMTWPKELGPRPPIKEGPAAEGLPTSPSSFRAQSRETEDLAQLYLEQR